MERGLVFRAPFLSSSTSIRKPKALCHAKPEPGEGILFETIAILGVCAGLFVLLELPRVSNARFWRATVTPLASIIGSGFLVIGPILDHAFGGYAPLAMVALCGLAYLFGAAIRENIRSRNEDQPVARLVKWVEPAASWSLSLAYIVSVAYYLNLFGSFAIHMTDVDSQTNARLLTTVMFLVVLGVGWTRGFRALEHLELHSVTLKLAIIGSLLVGLLFFNFEKAGSGEWLFNPASITGWQAVTLVFGLIVTVQGFEISRYLGSEYAPALRISSMRFAQILTTLIYLAYIVLMSYVFQPRDIPLDEAGIIDMMALVAPILPVILIAAALAAQFSAAIADTGGCGGLVDELTQSKVRPRYTYLLIAGLGIGLTWFADVFDIISYASRIFALYYALQAFEAAVRSWSSDRALLRTGFFGVLAILGLMVTIFGQAVE